MIHVIATIEIVAGKRDEFLAEFRKLIPLVHAEDGCIEYGPTIDIDSGHPAQGGTRDNVVTIVEKWASLDALKAHSAAPHMADYRQRVKGLALSTKLQILQPV